MLKTAKIKEVSGKTLNQEEMLWGVFYTSFEMSIFGLISEGQLMVWIRQIKSENKKYFSKPFSPRILGCESKVYGQIISSQKKVPCFCKCEVNSIY
jgi:hypothetical protein